MTKVLSGLSRDTQFDFKDTSMQPQPSEVALALDLALSYCAMELYPFETTT